jgi:hypothetical protein
MCDVLSKYGAPPALVRVVKGLHAEVRVRMEAGEDHNEFDSSLGVLQGAAASPVLFLFVIAAWFETVEWPDKAIQIAWYDGRRSDNNRNCDGDKFLTFLTRRSGELSKAAKFSIRDFLYADDAAVVFPSRRDMRRGMEALVAHGTRWGLEVHVAHSPDSTSKTEFIVVQPALAHKRRKKKCDKSPVRCGDAWFTHAKCKIKGKWESGVFKYLGSYITEDLSDDLDVRERISAASRAFGRFRDKIYANREVSAEAKAKAFQAFVVSILLYQSECWALRSELQHEMCVFFNRCVRVMTGINRRFQRDLRMTTAQMAKRAKLRTCESYITERCLKWLGHVARMPGCRLPRQTLFARVRGTRAAGGQQLTTRARLHKLISRIPEVLEEEGQHGLKDEILSAGWIKAANDRTTWGKIVHAVCDIEGDPVAKVNPKAEYMLEQRPYYVVFDDDD